MTDPVRQVLSQMCFEFIALANLWRDTGTAIGRRAEEEQAFFLHWMLGLALQHGDEWRKKVAEEVERRIAKARAVLAPETEGKENP